VEKESIGGIIIKGDGRHFSSGADLGYFEENQPGIEECLKQFQKGRAVLNYLEGLEKPVIAAIDGVCLGGGLEIALAAHIRYCSGSAVFGFPEINHGIVPGFDGAKRAEKLIGRSETLLMLLSGDTMDAQLACDMGLVNHVTEEKSSFGYAMEIMEGIIAKGVRPVACAIRAVNNAGNMEFDRAMEEEGRMFAELVIAQYGGAGEDAGK
jgi:enoyl-CoA hydratase/carnithine racemase